MITGWLIGFALAATNAGPLPALQRQVREDTIYTVHGKPADLEAFHSKFGKSWTGGELVGETGRSGVLRYWAYSDRTAAEARALMMPVILSGLKLEIGAFEEKSSFPKERQALDSIARKCGVSSDPFFITPKKEVQIVDAIDLKTTNCLTNDVKGALRLPIVKARKRTTGS